MTKNEILQELDAIGIITTINGDYYITEKYKELLNSSKTAVHLNSIADEIPKKSILTPQKWKSQWPPEIKETVGRTRVGLFLDLCEVPRIAKKGYRLRGVNKTAIAATEKFLDNDSIDAQVLIDVIKHYYKNTEMPKAYMKLIEEGLLDELYTDGLNGILTKGVNSKDLGTNQTLR